MLPIGTKVRLASGGPVMLVTDLDGPRIYCEWGPNQGMWLPTVCVDVIRNHHVL